MGQYVNKTIALGTWVDLSELSIPESDKTGFWGLEDYYENCYPLKKLDKVPFDYTFEYKGESYYFIYCKSSEINADKSYTSYELMDKLILTPEIRQEQEEITKLLDFLKVEYEPMKWEFVAYYG